MRRHLLTGLKVTVSLGLLAYVIWSIAERDGVEILLLRLSELTWPFLGLAVGLHFAAVLAGIQRYRLLLGRRGLMLPFAWVAKTYLIGRFIGAFTPSTMGLDLYRSIAVARRTGRKVESAAAVLAEKLFGLSGLAVVTLVLIPLGAGELLGASALPMAACILLVAGVGLFALGRPETMKRIVPLLPRRLAPRAEAICTAIAQGERSASGTVLSLLLSIVSHLATASVFVAAAFALNLSIDVTTLLVVGNAIVIATLLPISIGGVGVREGVAVLMLATAAVGPTDASLLALLGYVTGQVPALVGGLLNLVGTREPTPLSPAIAA